METIQQQLNLKVPPPKRPTKKDGVVIDEASEIVCNDVMQWLENNNDHSKREEVIDQLKEVLKNDFGCYDGYDLAKSLDDYHAYCPDADLVDRLDKTCYIISEAHAKAVKKWIRDYDIRPKFKIGDKVKFVFEMRTYEGEIYKIDDGGKYMIFCEKLGHVKKGVGTNGIVLEWEVVEQRNQVEG